MDAVEQIYQFEYRFVRSNGAAIVLKRSGLSYDDVSEVQWNMIRGGGVPGLLPLQIEEIDFEAEFVYSVQGMKMFSKQLQTKTWTQADCLHFTDQIATVLHNSSKYILNPRNYVLHPDFIFTDHKDQSPALIYVPIKEPLFEEPVQQLLMNLVLKMMEQAKDWDGAVMQKMIALLQNKDLSLRELRHSISELAQHHELENAAGETWDMSLSGEALDRSSLMEADHAQKLSRYLLNERQSEQAAVDPLSLDHAAVNGKTDLPHHQQDSEEEPPAINDEQKSEDAFSWHAVPYAVAAILSMMAWRFYFTRTEPFILYTVVFATAILFGGAYAVHAWMKKRKLNEVNAETWSDQEQVNPWWNDDSIARYQTAYAGESQAEAAPSESEMDSGDEVQKQFKYFQSLEQGMITELVSNENATVLLDDESVHLRHWLEIREGGTVKEVQLGEDRFIFGRDEATAHYVTTSKHASRNHFEISRKGGAYTLIDLGSSNGTYLNDKMIAPYKPMPLKHGDQIRVLDTTIVFKEISLT